MAAHGPSHRQAESAPDGAEAVRIRNECVGRALKASDALARARDSAPEHSGGAPEIELTASATSTVTKRVPIGEALQHGHCPLDEVELVRQRGAARRLGADTRA